MAVPSSSASKPNTRIQRENQKTSNKKNKETVKDNVDTNCSENEKQNPPAKRNRCPGLRVIGGRIYDSENGKTCHQCRQKTRDFMASCKNQKNGKSCPINFCHKCLLNRYGENAEEVALLDDWKCPKCRGVCNCSCCMKKRGHRPTGILVHAAKASGFSSVSELLHIDGHDDKGNDKIMENEEVLLKKPITTKKQRVVVLPKKPVTTKKDHLAVSPKKPVTLKKENPVISLRKRGKENSFDGNNLNPDVKKTRKKKQEGLKEMHDGNKSDAAPLKTISPKKKETSKKVQKHYGKNERSTLDKRCSKTEVAKEVCSVPIKKEEKKEWGNVVTKKVARASDRERIENEGVKPKAVVESREVKKCSMKLRNSDLDADIPVPLGNDLTNVAGIELAPEDVGHTLQFLEFCATFAEVFNMKKGEAESILRELTRGRTVCRGQYSLNVQFHIRLLSVILKDLGEKSPSLSPTNGKNSWIQALGKCVSQSRSVLKDLSSNYFDESGYGYDKLDFSKKLRLLNFLCDETLSTVDLRSWIDDQNLKFVAREKEAKETLNAAKDKEKRMKQKMRDEVAKAIIAKNGARLSISEHEAIISQIKAEAAQAHSEMLEAMDLLPKKRQRSDAVRTEPILLDINGYAYWRLNGYSGGQDILLQEMGTSDAVHPDEKWCFYDAEQKNAVEKYISLREKRRRFHEVNETLP